MPMPRTSAARARLPCRDSSVVRIASRSMSARRGGALGGEGGGGGLADLLGQVVDVDARAGAERHGALHGVLQLAHVAGPVITGELVGGARGETVDAAVHLASELVHEDPRQRQDVALALA